MRRAWGDDGAIACCVSPMLVGKQMQFFGARANLAKCLLYAINGGRDEITRRAGRAGDREPVRGRLPGLRRRAGQVRADDGLARRRVRQRDERHPLHARQVCLRAHRDGAARLRAGAHDGVRHRRTVGGGRQPVGDSLRQGQGRSATTPAWSSTTRPRATSRSSATTTTASINWPPGVVSAFMSKLRKYPTYRNALHTQSVLTITSNVVYGKNTGNTPDGRRQGRAVRAGRQPDARSRLARHHGVGRLGREDPVPRCGRRHLAHGHDGSGGPRTHARGSRSTNLVGMLDAFFGATGYHMNVNVLNREMLLDAMDHPEQLPAPDDPRVRLCRELRPPDPRAAAGCHQPHLPRQQRDEP